MGVKFYFKTSQSQPLAKIYVNVFFVEKVQKLLNPNNFDSRKRHKKVKAKTGDWQFSHRREKGGSK